MLNRRLNWTLAAIMLFTGLAVGREKAHNPPFKYVGGTENVPENCEGNLELSSTSLTFKCQTGSATVPYEAVRLMQYRPNVSRKVWKMKIKWKVRPHVVIPIVGGNRNRYFTIIFEEQGATRAIVVDVRPDALRPYLAEIDLKSGKQVEVMSFEEYD